MLIKWRDGWSFEDRPGGTVAIAVETRVHGHVADVFELELDRSEVKRLCWAIDRNGRVYTMRGGWSARRLGDGTVQLRKKPRRGDRLIAEIPGREWAQLLSKLVGEG